MVNHFVRSDLLKRIVDAFVANGNRYNLLNSAVLELFEYIRKVPLFICIHWGYDCLKQFRTDNIVNAGESEIIAEVYS